MNASSLVRSIFLAGLTTTLTLLVSGCSSCKPGKPGKTKAYHITVNLDESLKQSSVLVDIVPVTSASKEKWDSYSMSSYWRPGDARRNDTTDKITLSFISGRLVNEIGRLDPRWNKWLAQGVTHMMVLADLPGAPEDKPGSQDLRRQVLSLDSCYWPDKTTNLIVVVQKSGLTIQTPLRPAK